MDTITIDGTRRINHCFFLKRKSEFYRLYRRNGLIAFHCCTGGSCIFLGQTEDESLALAMEKTTVYSGSYGNYLKLISGDVAIDEKVS